MLIKDIPAHQIDGSPRGVLQSLKQHGAAVVIDSEGAPAGVLTYSDMVRLRTIVGEARRAADLFEIDRKVYTVRTDAQPAQIAKTIARHGLKTGVVVVDEDGKFEGYAFARDVRTEIERELSRAKENLQDLQKEHPAPYERVERIFRSGSGET